MVYRNGGVFMEYKFDGKTNRMLRKLEEQILKEYDESSEVGVRVNLLSKMHNTMSQYEKIMDNSDVIERMHQKLDELNMDLEASNLRLDKARDESREEDAVQEENIIKRLDGLAKKLETKIANSEKAMIGAMNQKVGELKRNLEARRKKGKKLKSSFEIKKNNKYCNRLEEQIKDLEYKIANKESAGDLVVVNEQNTHMDPRFVVIHETTPGKTKKYEDGIMTENVERPTKPGRWIRSFDYYDKLIRNQGITDRESAIARADEIEAEFAQDRPFGRTIGYHARIDSPGLMGRDEIVLLMPATASPDQISNREMTPYVYGIERCGGEEQDYHKAVATQAMLAAFVCKEMGYDKELIEKRVFPHNFFAKFKNSCPNRMLYASILLQQGKKRSLTAQEKEDIKEYVPWEVFSNLVVDFFERDRYPEELKRKFIYDMNDYEAYVKDPEHYNYEERRKERHISEEWVGKEKLDVPMNVTAETIKKSIEDAEQER